MSKPPKGFTLLELLVVVGLMSVLIGMVSFVFFGNKQDITTFHLSRELIAKKLNEVQTLALKSRQKARLAIFYDYIDDSSGERLHQEAIGELNRQGRFMMAHIYNEDNKEWVVAPIEPLLLPEGITVDFGTSKEDFLSDDENNLITWPKAGSALESSYVKGTWLVFTFGKDGKTFKEGGTVERVVETDYYSVNLVSDELLGSLTYRGKGSSTSLSIGQKQFKDGNRDFEHFKREFDTRHASSNTADGTPYRETEEGKGKWEAEMKSFWHGWHTNYDLFESNDGFTSPPKEKVLYLVFGGRADTGNSVEKCLKYAAGWKDMAGNIHTYYVDEVSQIQAFQWYDASTRYLYRIVLDKDTMSEPVYAGYERSFVISMMKIYEREGEDESSMQFPVVGPNDFIFPVKKEPVFKNTEEVDAHLSSFFIAIDSPTPTAATQKLYLLNQKPQTSRLPSVTISWTTLLGPSTKYFIKSIDATFGNRNRQPQRRLTVTEHKKDSSPLFSIILKAENNTEENAKLGFLVTPQGSLLNFESQTELEELKHALSMTPQAPHEKGP